MGHTPTPWMLASNKRNITTESGLIIAKMGPFGGFEEDAAFIIRAVNEHARHLNVLQDIYFQANAEADALDLRAQLRCFKLWSYQALVG